MKTLVLLTAALMAGFLAGFLPVTPQENSSVPAQISEAIVQPEPPLSSRSVSYKRSSSTYTLPDIELTDHESHLFALQEELDDERPVMLNFIFTSCSTICPVLTASMKDLQFRLQRDSGDVRLLSVSIDPEHDTPEMLNLYAKAQRAGPSWRFLTGDRREIVRLLKAFDNYRGDKMSHTAVTFLRLSPGDEWLRLDGFASGSDLYAEYLSLRKDSSG